jgi:hypothetical protein
MLIMYVGRRSIHWWNAHGSKVKRKGMTGIMLIFIL